MCELAVPCVVSVVGFDPGRQLVLFCDSLFGVAFVSFRFVSRAFLILTFCFVAVCLVFVSPSVVLFQFIRFI